MFTNVEMTKEERIEYWEMVLEEFRQSGLNKTTYCQRNDIPVSTLNYWANRIKDIHASRETAGDRFIELPIPEGNAKVIRYSSGDRYTFAPEIILEYSGIKISLNSSTPMSLLSAVLKEIPYAQ